MDHVLKIGADGGWGIALSEICLKSCRMVIFVLQRPRSPHNEYPEGCRYPAVIGYAACFLACRGALRPDYGATRVQSPGVLLFTPYCYAARATRQREAVGDLPQIRPVVYGAKDNDTVDKDSETRATVVETGVHHRSVQKLARLEYILSRQIQGSPPKLRIAVMWSIDSDHPLIIGRHAIG
jgi:hypothetical protein